MIDDHRGEVLYDHLSAVEREHPAIVRYTRAQADDLRDWLEKLGTGAHVIRTELFDYARELGVMIAYTDRPGYEEIRIKGREFDAYDLADKILAGEI